MVHGFPPGIFRCRGNLPLHNSVGLEPLTHETIKNKSVDSTPGHSATLQFTEYNDDGYFHCVEIIDPNDKTDEYTH